MMAKQYSILLKAASVRQVMSEFFPKPNDRVLIVNAGSGELALAVHKKYHESVKLDCYEHSSILFGILSEKLRSGVNIEKKSWRQIDFPEESFDWIISMNDLEFLKPKEREIFFEHLAPLLKNNGKMIITAYKPVGIFAWFRQLDWKLLHRGYYEPVDRRKMKNLFQKNSLKLLKTKIMNVLKNQHLVVMKTVKTADAEKIMKRMKR